MTIVAAVDRTDRAETVVNGAEELGKAFDETVHIVHVISRSEFVDLGIKTAKAGGSVNMDEVRERAEEVASEAADLNSPYETVGLVGDPAPQVIEYADEQDARYIVAAGRKRSPTGKVIFGSVLQEILLNANCSVVSIIDDS